MSRLYSHVDCLHSLVVMETVLDEELDRLELEYDWDCRKIIYLQALECDRSHLVKLEGKILKSQELIKVYRKLLQDTFDEKLVMLDLVNLQHQKYLEMSNTHSCITKCHQTVNMSSFHHLVDDMSQCQGLLNDVSTGQQLVDYMSVGQLLVDHVSTGQQLVDHMSVGQLLVDHVSTGQQLVDHMSVGQLLVDHVSLCPHQVKSMDTNNSSKHLEQKGELSRHFSGIRTFNGNKLMLYSGRCTRRRIYLSSRRKYTQSRSKKYHCLHRQMYSKSRGLKYSSVLSRQQKSGHENNVREQKPSNKNKKEECTCLQHDLYPINIPLSSNTFTDGLMGLYGFNLSRSELICSELEEQWGLQEAKPDIRLDQSCLRCNDIEFSLEEFLLDELRD